MLSQSELTAVVTINNNNSGSSNNNDHHSHRNHTKSSNINNCTTKPIQPLLNDDTSDQEQERRRRQQQRRLHSQARPDQQATGNGITQSKIDHERIWVYFKRSPGDANTLKCLLCSAELSKPNGDNLDQNASIRSLLWDHLKKKHEIDRNINDSGGERRSRRQVAFSSYKQHSSRNTKSVPSTSNPLSQNTNATIKSPNTLTSNHNNQNSNNLNNSMTKSGNQQRLKLISSSANAKKSPLDSNDIYDLRRDLDLIDYSDLSKASLKPLPASSLSRNLFERLNQLSSPVTRKLKFWNKKSFQVNQYDPCFKVIYLGNLGVQFWSKDESCLDKPLNTLWNNYLVNMKTEIVMRLTICNSGLKAITRQHGLTQYWSNRLIYCCSHKNYPKIFAWIYRHEGKKMRQELRCHAVFCSSPERASKMVSLLNQRLTCALEEFKREKKSRGQSSSIVVKCNSTTSSMTATAATAAMLKSTLPRTVPLRRQILAKGSANFRPPLERSKSAPKLTSIREEDYEFDEEDEDDAEEIRDDRQYNDDDDDDGGGGDGGGNGHGDESDNELGSGNGDDVSRDEFEYEQSFDDGDDDDSNSDYYYNEDELGKHDGLSSTNSHTHRGESNEETSNSSVYATGDISYDNIVANRHHLSANQERLDNESTLTAPILLKSSSSIRRSSLRSGSLNQNESLNSDRTESMSDGGQHELDSQLASTTSSTLNSCHIHNTAATPQSDHETDGTPVAASATALEVAEHNNHQNHNTVAHYFGQIKL